mgnify:CR=1 FL=1
MKKTKTAIIFVTLMLTISIFQAGCSVKETGRQDELSEPSKMSEQTVRPETPSAETADSEGSVFYVATNGDDSHPGTLQAPWKTIQKAADTVGEGDVVYVRGGVYNEKVMMKNSGSDGAYITFENYKGEIPVIDGKGLPVGENDEENGLIVVSNKSYIRIKGIDITNYVSTNENVPAGIRVDGAGKCIKIIDCKVYGISTTYSDAGEDRNAHGIAVYGRNAEEPLDSIVIDGCEIFDNSLGQSEAVVLNGNVTNFRVTNNKVHDNDNIGIDFIGFEGTAADNDQARNGVCSDNEVWNITSANNRTYDDACAGGIYVDGGKNIVIERNKVWNCDIGIEAASEHPGKTTEHIVIRNNLIYGCQAVAGIAFGGYDEARGSTSNIKIYNNTLYDNNPNIMIQFRSQSDTNVIKNNILYKGTGFDGDTENIVIANNIVSDPVFVNEHEADFHLETDSPAIDAGANDVFIDEFDLDNNNRVSGSSVDCGAYESS